MVMIGTVAHQFMTELMGTWNNFHVPMSSVWTLGGWVI